MSEFQYYEFQAIDRPLSEREMRILRSFSTRARITPTSFVNDYRWGDFRGNENAWMERFFDAFYYSSNWGARTFMLRLPSNLLDLKAARRYCPGEWVSVHSKKGRIVLTFAVDSETGEGLDTGEGWLSSLVPLRADIARGDFRALYLGWLYLVQSGSIKPGVFEPPVPAGLGQLTASLRSLVEFFRLDRDLITVAASASEPIGSLLLTSKELRARIAGVPAAKKDELLLRLIGAEGSRSVNPILQDFIKKHKIGGAQSSTNTKKRTVGQLLHSANIPEFKSNKKRR